MSDQLLKSIFQQTEAPLDELLKATTALSERARLVLLMRDIKAFDARIRGLNRRQMPTAEAWAEVAEAVAALGEKAPAPLRPALAQTGEYCLDRARALFKDVEARRSLVKSLLAKGAKPDFYVDAPLTIKGTDGGPKIIEGIASSTTEDLDGDRMSLNALQQMEAGFPGMVAFIGHRYQPPEDVAGTIKTAKLRQRGGEAYLDISIEVAEANPRAVQCYEMVKAGTKLGISVGILVWHSTPVKGSGKSGRERYQIDEILPLEASIVGLPSNRDSWCIQTRAAREKAALKARKR